MAAYLSKQAAANHRQIAATLRATLTIAPVSLFLRFRRLSSCKLLKSRQFHSKSVGK